MPLISAKCTNCGANLEVDNTEDAAICPYCNTAYVVEKAVNNYNTTNNITADVVNVYGGNVADFEIRSGVLVKYNGSAIDVVIPDGIVQIGSSAFEGCVALKSVIIPSGVTDIAACAFSGCTALEQVTIPDSVTIIGNYAFNRCAVLKEVVLPNGVVTIGNSAFFNCTNLKSIAIPKGVTTMGENAFSWCTQLEKVTIPDSVTIIRDKTFSWCTSLEKVTIPESVTIIGEGAFEYCKVLKSVIIPNSVISIGEVAFSETALESITIPDSVRYIGAAAFSSCANLKYVSNGEKYNPECFRGTPYANAKRQNSNGCYIATAVYGSYDCPQVWTLRRFRDDILAGSWYGRAFIRLYYVVSPTLVKLFGHTNWFKKLWRGRLDDMVEKLQQRGVESSPYCDREW